MATSADAFGRVDDDGTVSVREGDVWRAVGSFPDGTPDEALAYFTRKFDDLEATVSLAILLIGIVGMMQLQIVGVTADAGARSQTQALQMARELAAEEGPEATVLINLSGRGDKDMGTAIEWFGLGQPDATEGKVAR